jgi:TatD DNase family protein
MIGKDNEILFSDHDMQAIAEMLDTMIKNGVGTCITIGTTTLSSQAALCIAKNFQAVYAAVGIHPNDIADSWRKDIVELDKLIIENKDSGKLVAIGECGLDYHYQPFDKEAQKELFCAHIELAIKHQLPLIVHSRDAIQDTIDVIDRYKSDDRYKKEDLRGVMHCFSENAEYAKEVVDRGFVLGIGGAVTYPKNEYLRDVVRAVGIDAIVLETDAPYLAPQGYRGKPNTPAYIPIIAQEIARVLQMDVAAVAAITTKTVERIFGIVLE